MKPEEVMQEPQAPDDGLKEYAVTNLYDGNVGFSVRASSLENAAIQALGQVGWAVSLPDKEE